VNQEQRELYKTLLGVGGRILKGKFGVVRHVIKMDQTRVAKKKSCKA